MDEIQAISKFIKRSEIKDIPSIKRFAVGCHKQFTCLLQTLEQLEKKVDDEPPATQEPIDLNIIPDDENTI